MTAVCSLHAWMGCYLLIYFKGQRKKEGDNLYHVSHHGVTGRLKKYTWVIHSVAIKTAFSSQDSCGSFEFDYLFSFIVVICNICKVVKASLTFQFFEKRRNFRGVSVSSHGALVQFKQFLILQNT